MVTRIAPHVLGRRWLAGVSSTPCTTTDLWRSGSLAPVQLSCRFDAVLVATAFMTQAVLAELDESGVPPGPVLFSHGDQTSCWLVPVRPGADWQLRGTVLFTEPEDGGEPPSVLMPAPGSGRVWGMQWLVDPDGSGRLTRHRDLAVALRRARRALEFGGRRKDPDRALVSGTSPLRPRGHSGRCHNSPS
ncbi:hypothetical protein [Kitasatospora brasiliensis]|uniref:hypothetical protein n=1 Tax=Kitasatospora brasiliensis TaxID=3058040 RepID=UPI0029312045|nr:hypothetical protein [Kitasatospora sp. K002]